MYNNYVQDNHPLGPTPTNSPKVLNHSYTNQTARHTLPPSTPQRSQKSYQ